MITKIPSLGRSKRGVPIQGEVFLISSWDGHMIGLLRRKSDGAMLCLTRRAGDLEMEGQTKGAQRMFAKIMGYSQQAYVDLCQNTKDDAEADELLEQIEEARALLEMRGFTVTPGALK